MSVLPMPVGRDEHPLFRREPGQQGLFLDRIRRVRQLIEVAAGEFVAVHGQRPFKDIDYSEMARRRLSATVAGNRRRTRTIVAFSPRRPKRRDRHRDRGKTP